MELGIDQIIVKIRVHCFIGQLLFETAICWPRQEINPQMLFVYHRIILVIVFCTIFLEFSFFHVLHNSFIMRLLKCDEVLG